MGAQSKWVPQRVAEYCDGWFPVDARDDLAAGMEAIRSEATRHGRSKDALDFSVLMTEQLAQAGRLEARIQAILKLGFNRVLFLISPARPEEQLPVLERYAALVRKFV